ncbi:MAG: hypothetical protein ACREDR_02505 [Blastocatellia bacterium]
MATRIQVATYGCTTIRTEGVPARVRRELETVMAASDEEVSSGIDSLLLELEGAPHSYGASVLHLAAVRGLAHLIPEICDRWPELLDSRTAYGDTAFLEAASWGQDVCLVVLRSCGSNLTATNKAGMQALHNAAGEGQSGSLALLKKWVSELTPRDIAGWTPLRWALENDHKLCAQLLGWNAPGEKRNFEGCAAPPHDPLKSSDECPSRQLSFSFAYEEFRAKDGITESRSTVSNSSNSTFRQLCFPRRVA